LRVEEILNVLPESLQEKFLAKLEKISEKYGVEVKEGWIEVKERIFCGKYSRCQKCASGQGHVGPFYYFHFRVNGKLRTAYLGKPKEGNSKPLRKTETWKDWLDMSPEQLRSHLQTLSAEQIRSIAKSILSHEQLRKGKNELIETIIFTLKEIKAHMKIGPPIPQIPGLKLSKIEVTPREAFVNSLILEARKKITRGQIYHKHKD